MHIRTPGETVRVLLAALLLAAVAGGCAGGRPPAAVEEDGAPDITITDIEGLEQFENLLPVPPDSIVRLYRQFDRKAFYGTFQPDLDYLSRLVDSLNAFVPPGRRIDTLAIDHSFGGFGNAARSGRSLYLSSSYFFVYRSRAVLRSVTFHEYGHLFEEMLDDRGRGELDAVWKEMRGSAILYVFRDGEYSGNAWFGGHPEDSPEELFASAFNIFNTRPDELRARLRYVDDRYRELVDRLRTLVGVRGLVLFE
jgi:hypothetical protein